MTRTRRGLWGFVFRNRQQMPAGFGTTTTNKPHWSMTLSRGLAAIGDLVESERTETFRFVGTPYLGLLRTESTSSDIYGPLSTIRQRDNWLFRKHKVDPARHKM
ncbi:hypothetical protein DBV08_05735 [Rhodococcus sp. KBW08]|nr:hypothetical protein DBV08_05735 [Rhodococcus sp. KBW08]